MSADCEDCGLPYGTDAGRGFHDLIIPNHIWRRISTNGDETGLLCANCICARLAKAGISDVPAAYMSGPLATIDRHTMSALREAENSWEWIGKYGEKNWRERDLFSPDHRKDEECPSTPSAS